MQLKTVLKEINQGIYDLMDQELDKLSDELVSKIIEIMIADRKIYVYGAGRSGYLGRAFVMRLVQCGFNAHFLGESSTPTIELKDMLLLISGSGKTASVEMIIKSASKTPIYIITSQKLPSKHFKMVITIKGKNKMNNELSVLPLGSPFEINAFLYLECIIAKIIGDYPPAKDEIRKIYQKYYHGKMIVF